MYYYAQKALKCTNDVCLNNQNTLKSYLLIVFFANNYKINNKINLSTK